MSIFSKLSKIDVKLSQITLMNRQININDTPTKTLRTITTMNVKLEIEVIVDSSRSSELLPMESM